MNIKTKKLIVSLSIVSALSACGGSGDDSGPTVPPITTSSLSGSVSKGSLINADVNAEHWAGSNWVSIAKGTTDQSGNYSLSIPDTYQGNVVRLTVTPNANTKMLCDVSDCGFGSSLSVEQGFVLKALVSSIDSDKAQGAITPLTHMAASRGEKLIFSGQSPADAVNLANSELNAMFGFDIQATEVKPLTSTTTRTDDEALYAAINASFHKLANQSGHTVADTLSDVGDSFIDGALSASDTISPVALVGALSSTVQDSSVKENLNTTQLAKLEYQKDKIENEIDANGDLKPKPGKPITPDSDIAQAKDSLQDIRSIINQLIDPKNHDVLETELTTKYDLFDQTINELTAVQMDAAFTVLLDTFQRTDFAAIESDLRTSGVAFLSIPDELNPTKYNTIKVYLTGPKEGDLNGLTIESEYTNFTDPNSGDTISVEGVLTTDLTLDELSSHLHIGEKLDVSMKMQAFVSQASSEHSIRFFFGPVTTKAYKKEAYKFGFFDEIKVDTLTLHVNNGIDKTFYGGSSFTLIPHPMVQAGEREIWSSFALDKLHVWGAFDSSAGDADYDYSAEAAIYLDLDSYWNAIEEGAVDFDIDYKDIIGDIKIVVNPDYWNYLEHIGKNAIAVAYVGLEIDIPELPTVKTLVSYSKENQAAFIKFQFENNDFKKEYTVAADESLLKGSLDYTGNLGFSDNDGFQLTLNKPTESVDDVTGTVKIDGKKIADVSIIHGAIVKIHYIDGTFETLN